MTGGVSDSTRTAVLQQFEQQRNQNQIRCGGYAGDGDRRSAEVPRTSSYGSREAGSGAGWIADWVTGISETLKESNDAHESAVLSSPRVRWRLPARLPCPVFWCARCWRRRQATPNRRMVVIFQRGAADGLNVVVPYREKNYYAMRPNIAIPQNQVIDLDGFFGLHPSLTTFQAALRCGASGDCACGWFARYVAFTF